jgi:phage terminase Nu1 subunit (DNA packaging protein)
MPKEEIPRNYSALPVSDVAELLGVTDRQVRNWIKDKGLPAKSDPRGLMLDWPTTLKWYVAYQADKTLGNGGNRRSNSGPDGSEEPQETFDQAILRKTKAEADLKELQLARERGEVASIADVERVLVGANKSIQTRILALPSSLAPQLIGIDDRKRVNTILERYCNDVLSNMASIDAVRESRTAQPDSEDE